MKKLKQAIILAGGLGTRIYPLSKSTPKPMIDIGGYPFLYYLIERLEKYKFSEVLILVGYKSEKFKKLFHLCKNFKINIKLIYSPTNYNTGARLKAAYPHMKDIFFLLFIEMRITIHFQI